jgi:hypothetical protein
MVKMRTLSFLQDELVAAGNAEAIADAVMLNPDFASITK